MRAYLKEEIVLIIEEALNSLYIKDLFLIQNDINERCICHKFAEYLQDHFSEYNVDCEYNRHGVEIKELPGISNYRGSETDRIYPDIIVHIRNNDNHNLLLIEAKNHSGMADSLDFEKLKFFTSQNGLYRYSFGLFVRFNHFKPACEWFENGRKCTL